MYIVLPLNKFVFCLDVCGTATTVAPPPTHLAPSQADWKLQPDSKQLVLQLAAQLEWVSWRGLGGAGRGGAGVVLPLWRGMPGRPKLPGLDAGPLINLFFMPTKRLSLPHCASVRISVWVWGSVRECVCVSVSVCQVVWQVTKPVAIANCVQTLIVIVIVAGRSAQ